MERRTWGKLVLTGVVLAAFILLVGQIGPAANKGGKAASAPKTTTTSTTTVPEGKKKVKCASTWKVHELNNGGHRIVAEGIYAIDTAKTEKQARKAAYTHLETIKGDPDALQATVYKYLHRRVGLSTLHSKGCMTKLADALVLQVAIAIGQATITPDVAPADGTNSGADAKGKIVSATTAGVSGNRKAIKIVLKDGSVFWIMARCGNFVTKGQDFPPGPTDNPPPKPPKKGKAPTSWECQQNGTGPNCPFHDVQQEPQDNTTSQANGVNTGPTPGAPSTPPPPADRPPGDLNGGSGSAAPPTGPTDDSDKDVVTTAPPTGTDTCPLGPGNC